MTAAPRLASPRTAVTDPRDFYAAELAWLDRLIEREILRLRARYELSLDELRGLCISDEQVNHLVHERLAQEAPEQSPLQRLTDEALAAHAGRRDDTPLAELVHRFSLSGAERSLLLLALAPQLDLKYETLYAYLNNDVTRKHLTVDLALRLLARDETETGQFLVTRSNILFESGMLEHTDPGECRSLLTRGITLAPPVTHFLLGLPVSDVRLPAGIRILPADPAAQASELLGVSARAVLTRFSERHPPRVGLTVCAGDTAAEQVAAARLYASRHAHAIVTLPLAVLASSDHWAQTARRLHLLARLIPAIGLVFDEFDQFPQERAALLQLTRQLKDLAGAMPVIWAVPHAAPWVIAVADLPFAELTLPQAVDTAERAESWRAALARQGFNVEPATIDALADRFALPGSRIVTAARSGTMLASGASEAELRAALWRAAQCHSGHALGQLAKRVVKPHTWKHLVLPDATLRQIREVTAAIAQRERVYKRWRMAERTGNGTGLMVLFSGASGTGKTMTAAVIANDLGLELYRIDLASVVSKYIGETEKNLAHIFQNARSSNAMLFFDEADALLGKRSEVKDAHDRYANIEVAYLLQSMEEHDGVVILASNLAKNVDQAFARRMHYVVEFPRPDARMRERLWRGMFPKEAPLSADVDFAFLSEQFETSGGEIQSIALEAAFLASAESAEIGMGHLVKAMARHQLKQGNAGGICGFKQYHGMTRRG